MAQQLPQIHSVHSSQRRPAHGSARPAAPSLLARVPWGFLAVIAALVAYGLVVCWSAVQGDADYNFTRQLQGVAVGLVAMVALWAFDYRRLSNLTTALLVINVVLILLPHIPGLGTDAGMGAKSWIKIGMQVQPGEFAKVTVVLFAASLLARYQGTLDDWREYCKVLGMLLVPFAAIMTQPDLGTGLVYLAISAVVLVMGGAKGRYLLITLIAGIAAIAAVFAVDELLKYQQSDGTWEYRLLKNYQRSRLLVFLNPEGDLSGDGYNLAQAKIAIGSGGLFGKGIGNSTQSTHGFLPEAPTD
ncbi:MAG: FtsW/RodA/SpoVE family cell cycle protein, partial [Adlercreutzia sp.]